MLAIMRLWLVIAAVNGALAVIAGAFAAHGLQGRLSPAMLTVFDTGARYQMYHALAMGLAAVADAPKKMANITAMLFLAGILLFSGSLYAMALSGNTALGIITPIGGAAFIAGWICLALKAARD
jgi:uncharacterized membrane protein YgdD (TMEM256/DUF423 family)